MEIYWAPATLSKCQTKLEYKKFHDIIWAAKDVRIAPLVLTKYFIYMKNLLDGRIKMDELHYKSCFPAPIYILNEEEYKLLKNKMNISQGWNYLPHGRTVAESIDGPLNMTHILGVQVDNALPVYYNESLPVEFLNMFFSNFAFGTFGITI